MAATRLTQLGLIAVLLTGLLLATRGILSAGSREAAPDPKAAAGNEPTTQPVTVALLKKATTADLGGSDRYLTCLSTDKPIYRPGEKVYVRGVVLNAASHKPLPRTSYYFSTVQIKGPKGDIVASGYTQMADSVLAFSWDVPADQSGGQYTVVVNSDQAPAERNFEIRAYRAPRLKSQIVFLRDGYGPGDTVAASLHVERAEGGAPAGAKVSAVARVDGAEAYRGGTKIDAAGNCQVRFDLPKQIERGEGSLALVIEDGGVVETASKTIPILVKSVDLAIYPEGGDLVAGLIHRVYVEARTPAGKPADVAGVVVDSNGRELATFRTSHEGRGRFELAVRNNGNWGAEKYVLKVTEPSGIAKTFPLPAVQAAPAGAVIRAVKDVYQPGEQVRLQVGSTEAAKLTVTLSRREIELAETQVEVKAGELAIATLRPPDDADGVLVATVWSAAGRPLAERLVFRQPARSIRVTVTPNQSTYVPGGRVALNVQTSLDGGGPVGAVVGLTVTDDSVLEMIEKREQAPRLPVMVFIEPEVRELADAHVYLDPNHPKAAEAVDLLLGTQGWRRFAFVNTAKFLSEHGDAARRVLALRIPPPTPGPGAPGGVGDWDNKAAFADDGRLVKQGAAVRRPRGDLEIARRKADGKPEEAKLADKELQPGDEFRAALEKARAGKPQNRIIGLAGPATQPGWMGDAAGEALPSRTQQAFVAVREYAHQARPDRKLGDRTDFTETLYWNAAVATNPETGKATVNFAANDSVTAFRVLADAFDSAGAVGAGVAKIESIQPFYVEPKLPLEVTMGDVIQLPISLVNGTSADLKATLKVSGPKGMAIEVPGEGIALKPNSRQRVLATIKIGDLVGLPEKELVIDATAGEYADRVTRKLRIRPSGFPVEIGQGGMLEAAGRFSCNVAIPKDVIVGSVHSAIRLYPSPLANLTEALKRLMQEPNGCFEQTSSTTYPLVMAQQYFTTHTGVDPAIIERSNQLLDNGYKRLIGFECKTRGYEWFGSDPGHETLSAYGLMEFTDMAAVRTVDKDMLGRTRQWVLNTRDGKGGFNRERRAYHTWIEDRDCSNGYILWALLASGEPADSLAAEITAFKAAAEKSANSYVVALGANVASLAGDAKAAGSLMARLAEKQAKDGHVDGATTSIVGSGGEALDVEATALTALAWMADPAKAYAGNVEKAMNWLAESCKAGRYGSTQSTVLCLRAIVAYDKTRSRVTRPGSVRVYVDGQPVGDVASFDATTSATIELPDISELLSPAKAALDAHAVELRMTDGSAMPFSVAINYNRQVPDSAEACKVRLAVTLRNDKLAEGEATEAEVTVTNQTDQPIPTPVAIIGVPGGLEVRHDQLKELAKAGRIAAYEVIGRELVLYWRSLDAGEKVTLPVNLVAAVPGTYTGPASRAYLYYTDEFKQWAAPLKVTIVPRPAQ